MTSLIKFEVVNADRFAYLFEPNVQILVEAFVVVVTRTEIEDGFGASILPHKGFKKRMDFHLDVGFITSAVFGLRSIVFDVAILVVCSREQINGVHAHQTER